MSVVVQLEDVDKLLKDELGILLALGRRKSLQVFLPSREQGTLSYSFRVLTMEFIVLVLDRLPHIGDVPDAGSGLEPGLAGLVVHVP